MQNSTGLKLGPIELLLILGLIILAGIGLFMVVRGIIRSVKNTKTEAIRAAKISGKAADSRFANTSQSNDPLEVLKLRLVKGEITKEQFEEMKQMLK